MDNDTILGDDITRRKFLKYSTGAIATVSLSSFNFGCSGGSSTPAPLPEMFVGYPNLPDLMPVNAQIRSEIPNIFALPDPIFMGPKPFPKSGLDTFDQFNPHSNQLPAINLLARSFGLCDNYFCGVPSQTITGRDAAATTFAGAFNRTTPRSRSEWPRLQIRQLTVAEALPNDLLPLNELKIALVLAVYSINHGGQDLPPGELHPGVVNVGSAIVYIKDNPIS